jgi:hypothetical protein
MKAYWEWRYSSTYSFTLALDGGEWSASRPGRFTHRERDPGTHWIGGCVGPRAVLDTLGKRKIPSPRRELNPRTPIIQPVEIVNTKTKQKTYNYTYLYGCETSSLDVGVHTDWRCLKTEC